MSEKSSPSDRLRSDLRVRTLSAIVLVAVAAVELYIGGTLFILSLALLTAALVWETVRLVIADRRRWRWSACFFGAVAVVTTLPMFDHIQTGPIMLACLALVGLMSWIALRGAQMRRSTTIVAVSVALGCVVLSEAESTLAYGGYSVLLFLVPAVVATDIGAYFSGRLIGGPKLAPAISPNKTWAGSVGGVISAILIGLACLMMFGKAEKELVSAALMLAILSVCAQLGDLGESWLKRRAGAKDSGSLIPGHGGVLDRFDGFIGAAVLGVGPWLVYRQFIV